MRQKRKFSDGVARFPLRELGLAGPLDLPGPKIKPKTWANETIETAGVLSRWRVAAERYDLQAAILPAGTPNV